MWTTRIRLVACWGLLLLLLLLHSLSAASGAEFQPTKSAVPVTGVAQPKLSPLLVCPPRFSTPIFVPADELLREAEQLQPVTPEGWIVHNRPVSECVNCLGDVETLRYQMYEYPLKLRQYNSRIRLLQAELASWQRKMTTYKYFNKAGALSVTFENTQLTILGTQEQLRNLRYERMLFVRQHNLENQLRQGVLVEQPVASIPSHAGEQPNTLSN